MKLCKKLFKTPNALFRFTGLKRNEFNELVKKIRPLNNESEKKRLLHKNRKRKIGGGRNFQHNLEVQVVMILTYYRLYLTQEVIGYLFGIDQSNISRLVNRLGPLMEKAADPQLSSFLNQVKTNQENISRLNFDNFISEYPELFQVISDATEVRCYRPKKNNDERKLYYSGKKKAFMLKKQITISRFGKIRDVSKTYPGSVHDKTIIDNEKTITKFPKRTQHLFDSGYQGVSKDHPEHYITVPIKKTKGCELCAHTKEINRITAKIRIKVEHAIGRLKQFKICAGIYRGRKERFDQIFRNIAALSNFKIGFVYTE